MVKITGLDKTTTADDIREQLGLQPFINLELAAYRRWVSEISVKELGVVRAVQNVRDGRCTGRTTRIICEALAALARGAAGVMFIADSSNTARELYAEPAQMFARKLKLDPTRIVGSSRAQSEVSIRGRDDWGLFYAHPH